MESTAANHCQVLARWGHKRKCTPRMPSVVAMAHLGGLSFVPIMPRYSATASTPAVKSGTVWTTTTTSSMQERIRPRSSPPGGRKRSPWARGKGFRRSEYNTALFGLPCPRPL